MRVGIVFLSKNNRDKLLKIVKGLSSGMEGQGHQVDIIDGDRDVNTKLTIYSYIAVGTASPTMLGGKIPETVKSFLDNAGIVTGKRSFAFILSTGLRKIKTLTQLMQVMEHEGMYLKNSDIISTEEEAVEIGKRLHISK